MINEGNSNRRGNRDKKAGSLSTSAAPAQNRPAAAVRRQQRRQEAERRLRQARLSRGCVKIRLQPYVEAAGVPCFKCLTGQAVVVTLDEPIDFWDLWADTVRFWRLWRPGRRRSAAGQALIEGAWDALTRASQDVNR